jgi:hypothetical protein
MTGTFTPRISVTETYDDNIDLSPDNEESDWITVASPGFSLLLQSAKTDFSLDMTAGLTYYLQDSTRDTIRYTGRLSWDQKLAEYLSLNLSNTLTRSEDPVREDQGRIVDISSDRDVEYRNTGQASLSYQFGPQDSVTVGYRNTLLDSRSDQTEDSRSNQGFLDLSTWFVPQFGINLTSSFARWEFQQSKDFTGFPSEDFYLYQAGLTMNYQWQPQRITYARYNILYLDYDEEHGIDNNNYIVHQTTVGFSSALGANTSLGASFGYWRRDINNENSEDGASLNANFNAQGEKATLNVQTDSGYDLDVGTSQNQGFSKYSDSSCNVSYQLAENLNLFATARYRWEDYADTNRTDHTYGGRIGFNHTFRNWFTLSLEGGHLRRDSNENNQEFKDNRVVLRLTAAYPIPFWD